MKRGLSVWQNIIQPWKRGKFWLSLQHAQTLGTLSSGKEARRLRQRLNECTCMSFLEQAKLARESRMGGGRGVVQRGQSLRTGRCKQFWKRMVVTVAQHCKCRCQVVKMGSFMLHVFYHSNSYAFFSIFKQKNEFDPGWECANVCSNDRLEFECFREILRKNHYDSQLESSTSLEVTRQLCPTQPRPGGCFSVIPTNPCI